MGRPLRLEFSGALYHVTSRGNERKAIFRDEQDFAIFMDVLASVCDRFNWVIHAYCLMHNHYHVLMNPRGQVLHCAISERLTIFS